MLKYLRHSRLVLLSYFWTARLLCRFLLNRSHTNDASDLLEEGVTLVITSCNRPRLLEKTLESFIEHNTFQIKKAVFIEDGQSKESAYIASAAFRKMNLVEFKIIVNDKNLGQLNSIDKAYSYVSTRYVFHLEEDWEFVKPGFIEASMKVLELDNTCLFVSLRHYSDQQQHPNSPFYHIPTKSYLNHYAFLWRMVWTGFGFNPSLRRMSDYFLLKPYGLWNKRETSIGLAYHILGKKPLIFHDKYYVVHKGFDQSTDLDPRFRKA